MKIVYVFLFVFFSMKIGYAQSVSDESKDIEMFFKQQNSLYKNSLLYAEKQEDTFYPGANVFYYYIEKGETHKANKTLQTLKGLNLYSEKDPKYFKVHLLEMEGVMLVNDQPEKALLFFTEALNTSKNMDEAPTYEECRIFKRAFSLAKELKNTAWEEAHRDYLGVCFEKE